MSAHAIGYLARQILASRPDILFTARDGGLAAAVRSYFAGSHCTGGCGHDPDGMFRRWDFEGKRIQYRVGTFDADPVVVPLRDVFAWALDRIDHPRWLQLERLRQARSDALNVEFGDRDLDHRMTFRPSDVTAAERARVGEAHARRTEIQRAEHALIVGVLADGAVVAGQLELLDPEEPAARSGEAAEFPDVDGQFALFTDEQVAA